MWVILLLSILINEVMPAPSNAPEWVELYNPSLDVIDIGGWYIDDETHGGTQIIIAQGTHIAPGELHIITFSSAILNNTGDSVTLYDASGQLIDRIDFGTTKNTESISRVPDGSSVIIKTPPSPGVFNAALASPTPLEPTVTPSVAIIADSTATITSTQLLPTELPSNTRTLLPTSTESPTHTPSPTKTPSDTRTLLPTSTESPTRTPSPTKTPSDTRTPSPTKTPSDTRTPSPTKTPSMSKTPSNTSLVSSTRTPSFTRTASATKTMSRTRTPRPSKTLRLTRTPKSTQTPSITKTPRLTRTQIQVAPKRNMHDGNEPQTTPIISITAKANIPQLIVCPPPPSTLDHWELRADGHHIVLPDSRTCVTVDLPPDPPTHWQLSNPHGLVMASIDVFAQYCAIDISDCQPSPTMVQMALHVEYQRPQITPTLITATPYHTTAMESAPIHAPHSQAPSTATSTIPIGMLLMLGGWIALKVLARPAPDVLYSEAGEDAASSADSLSSESRKV